MSEFSMKNISPGKIIFLVFIFFWMGGVGAVGFVSNMLGGMSCPTMGAPSRSPEYGWRITSMDVAAQIGQDGELKIQEKVTVNFDIAKHGIYRTIPLLFEPKGEAGAGYKSSNFSAIEIQNVQVTQDGAPAMFTNTVRNGSLCTGSWLAREYNQEEFIKIGDPDSTITGQHEYVISYIVKNALRDDRGYPELYWNMIGHGWGVNIDGASIRLTADKDISFVTDKIYCYSGLYGSNDTTSCKISNTDKDTIDFTVENLLPYHGTTIQVAVKPEYAEKIASNTTGSTDRTQEYTYRKWYYLLGLLPFLYFLYIWHKNGRDPASRGIIAPRFDAPGDMSPAQSGMVLDQSVDSVDIASIIISIAQKGWMKIIYKKGGLLGIGEDYLFEKSSSSTAKALTDEEKTIFDNIFIGGRTNTPLSTLKNNFYLVVDEAKSKLYNWAVTSGYLKTTPGPIQTIFVPGYVLIVIFWFVAITISSPIMIAIMICSTILSIVVLYFYRFYTAKGKVMQEELLGLKMYMSTAEKDRIEFHNAPEKSPELFLKLLPYAMALGVVRIWADKFKDLEMTTPDWYVGPYTHFNAAVFAGDLTRASSSFASTMTSVPSRSGSGGGGGGGFSGGGGGGGGGGSW